MLRPMFYKIQRVTSHIRALLPNAGWDAIKWAWKWVNTSPYITVTFVGVSTMIGTYVTAYLKRLLGAPPELQGVLIIAVIWLLGLSSIFAYRRLRRQTAATDGVDKDAGQPLPVH